MDEKRFPRFERYLQLRSRALSPRKYAGAVRRAT
jgi:hypothetical protein